MSNREDVTLSVLVEIGQERARQDAKWGEQNHPNGTGPEDFQSHAAGVAERYKLATDVAAADGTITFRHILLEEVFEAMAEEEPAKLRAELIQVAAVAAQWVETIDRREDAAS